MSDTILELTDVKTHFPVTKGLFWERHIGTIRAVDGVSLSLRRGEVLGLVGESGCGKSTLARTILRLVPMTDGDVVFEGRSLRSLSARGMRPLRPRMQMVFQDPYASLNPRMTVSDTIAEPMIVHGVASRREAASRVSALMERVGLAPRFMKKYPHEFSGGQRQRIAIARALATGPRLIIADEPVSALDVSVQAQILNLIADLRRDSDLTLILISHDLAVVRHLADRIAVMYLGKIVEIGEGETVFNRPLHPYTKALLSAIPVPDPDREQRRSPILLRGDPPSLLHPPTGCPFHPRCPIAELACAGIVPELVEYRGGRKAACRLIFE